MSTVTHEANREIAIYYIAAILGIPEYEVTNKVMLGSCAHFIASMIYFRTGVLPQVYDLGAVTAGDILEQLQ